MISTIVASKRGFLVKLNDGTRLSIEALGSRAEKLLQGQDVALWASASDVGFLRTVAAACRQLGLKHLFTRPYTPRTNGKAERFIQSSLREWAHADIYPHSEVRTEKLSRWIHRYNWHRPHCTLGLQPPVSRLSSTQNNLLTLHR
jgi:transposase InsO family protein